MSSLPDLIRQFIVKILTMDARVKPGHDEGGGLPPESASAKLRAARSAGYSMRYCVNKGRLCLRILGAVLLLVTAAALPARAQTNVDLQLVLAVDASGSVNDTRFELQKQGYAAAFRNPQVIKAIMCRSCPGCCSRTRPLPRRLATP
jgi:hypothetical protein